MNELIGQGRTSDIFRYDEYRVTKIFKEEFSHLVEFEYERAKAIDSIGYQHLLQIYKPKCTVKKINKLNGGCYRLRRHG